MPSIEFLFQLAGNLAAFLLPMFAALIGTFLVRRHAVRAKILDVPNERSSHSTATPRGGGLAVVITLVLALFTALWIFPFWRIEFIAAVVAGLPIAVAGWIDDTKGLSAKTRLLVQAIAAAAFIGAVAQVGDYSALRSISLFGLNLTGWIAVLVFALFVIWMTNLYNFMDGIDGLLGMQALTVSLILARFASLSGASGFFYFSIAGACFGFLFLNWSPAKIFMGDVGSAFLGFIFAASAPFFIDTRLAGSTLADPELFLSAKLWPIVLIVHASFLGDATWTLLRRLARGEKPHQAHRTHLYQKLTQHGFSHRTVALAYGLYNILWLSTLAISVSRGGIAPWVGLLAAYAPIMAAAICYRAGTK